jgi:hypothetical protein
MDDSESWKRARYLTLIVVIALHAALIVMLVKFNQVRNASTLTSTPLQLRFLPPERAPLTPPGLPSKGSFKSFDVVPPTLPTLTAVPMESSEVDSTKSIDWAAEAKIVAAASAAGASHRPFGTHVPSEAAASAAAGASSTPAHKAGDQDRTDTGDWVVFVSNNCYQISKALSGILRALPLQTYCLRKGKEAPRGDLFQQLPAYKKYHPDQ